MDRHPESRLQRRVGGYHDLRMDGMLDLVIRARGSSVLDVGCNRGLVGFEMANNGATLVHGCDIYPEGIQTAQHLFADLRNCASKFEVVDLTMGPAAMKEAFGSQRYDIVLVLGTIHKLARAMPEKLLQDLIADLGERTIKHFGWRGYEVEADMISRALPTFKLVHQSWLSHIGPAFVWERS